MIWKSIARPLLFRLDAERTHYLAMNSFHSMCKLPGAAALFRARYRIDDSRLNVTCAGLDFPNPVGLGAGFDKGAKWFNDLSNLGFGAIEVGTITQHAQPGNDKPRLFRLPMDQALLNRMGFNNAGAAAVADQLSGKVIRPVLGINIGKSKVTPLDLAAEDYLTSLRSLYRYAAYFTINVSSPNTPGLRDLQALQPLTQLLTKIRDARDQLAAEQGGAVRPLFVKIAPDLDDAAIEDIIAIIRTTKIDGVIATNTTVSRENLATPADKVEALGAGGLSGKPLVERSRRLVAKLHLRLRDDKIPVIGVGGILTPEDAWQMIVAGATMIQTYTGFIYEGPGFVKRVLKHLSQKLTEHQLANISEAIGRDAEQHQAS